MSKKVIYCNTDNNGHQAITLGKTGWVIDYHSIIQGQPTGLRLLLFYGIMKIRKDRDLNATWDVLAGIKKTYGDVLIETALDCYKDRSPLVKVLRKGEIVR